MSSASEAFRELSIVRAPMLWMRQGHASTLTHKYTQVAAPTRSRRPLPEPIKIDAEAGMLSGISQKRRVRSSPYWFTEFCNSQCLSHFAAPFIVVRAETSVAESCKGLTWDVTVEHMLDKVKVQETMATSNRKEVSGHPSCPAALE